MRVLLLGYMWLYVHRPFDIWPTLAEIRLELLYMLCIGGLWLAAARKTWIPSGLHWAFAVFAVAVVVCWLASPWNNVLRPEVENYLKLFPCYLLIVTLVYEERHLKLIVLGFLCIMTLYMAHSLYEYLNGRYMFRMNVARLVGIDGTLSDPNRFGTNIVCALPFLVPAWVGYRNFLIRGFLLGYVGLTFLCIALTGSRAAFLGLVLCLGMVIWRSRWRWPLALAVVLASPILWAALPQQFQNRFETIIDPSAGPQSARDSSDDRIIGLLLGLKLWGDFPLTGCGPGMWIPATGRKIQSHNLYAQLAGEMGTLGVLTFGAVLLTFWLILRRLHGNYRQHPQWGRDFVYHVVRAAGLGLLLLLFFGMASHNLFRHQWLWYGGFLIVAGHCIHQRLKESQAPGGLCDSSSFPRSAWERPPGTLCVPGET
jgi:hypothetical protein